MQRVDLSIVYSSGRKHRRVESVATGLIHALLCAGRSVLPQPRAVRARLLLRARGVIASERASVAQSSSLLTQPASDAETPAKYWP